MVGRRGFLGFFAGGIAAGPKKIAQLAGIELNPMYGGFTAATADDLIPSTGRSVGPRASSSNPKPPGFYERKGLKKLNLIKFFAPEWYTDKRRDEAKAVHYFDLDLSTMKSVSIAGKVAIQRERNFHRQLQLEEDRLNLRLQERMWTAANLGDDSSDDYDF